MKTIIRHQILGLSLVIASLFISATSFAALNAYLKLKRADGKSYSCRADASGNFKFSNVEPGTYKLLWVLPPGKGELSGTCRIEISSFSWGVTNSGSISRGATIGEVATSTAELGSSESTGQPATKSSSNIQNNLTTGGGGGGKVSVQDFQFSCDASKVSRSGSGELFTIVLEDILVSSIASPSGKVGGMSSSYDLKQNTK